MTTIIDKAIDYVSTYFQHPTVTSIAGEPAYDTVLRLKKEIQANAASVPCELGGGNNGYLGIVLRPAEYAKVSATAFNCPARPGPLVIPPRTPAYEQQRLREQHRDRVNHYH